MQYNMTGKLGVLNVPRTVFSSTLNFLVFEHTLTHPNNGNKLPFNKLFFSLIKHGFLTQNMEWHYTLTATSFIPTTKNKQLNEHAAVREANCHPTWIWVNFDQTMISNKAIIMKST